ncbi:MAG: lipase family protein [Gammaproteobacteria bacterium]
MTNYPDKDAASPQSGGNDASLIAHVETAIRDCAICYLWNPYEDSHTETLSYNKFSMTFYAGIDHDIRTAYIVFRGTDSLLDWAKNIVFFPPLPLFHPAAHPLFVLEWKARKRLVVDWLLRNKNHFDEIVVTGHSLGGALAKICAYDLSKYKKEGVTFSIRKVVTIGAPRVYTLLSRKRVERQLSGKIIRLSHTHDVVPKLPPRLIGYRHVGRTENIRDSFHAARLDRKETPFDQFLSSVVYWASGGPLAKAIDNIAGEGTGLVVCIMLLAGLGSAGELALNIMVWSILGVMVCLIPFGIALYIRSHSSAIYASSKSSLTVLGMLSKIRTAERLKDSPIETRSDGRHFAQSVYEIPKQPEQLQQSKFLRNFRGFFGDYIYKKATVHGPGLIDNPPEKPKWKTGKEDLEIYQNACMYLLSLGYTLEEVQQFVKGNKFARPANWKRFYKYSNFLREESLSSN